jgi:UDP-3-O-[3-hydroxymyristoyl] glucosamine N-acyltransferase
MVANALYPHPTPTGGVHPTAVIASTARIGERCTIGAYTVIGEHVIIGEDGHVDSHSVIDDHVHIGKCARIFSHVTISCAHIGDYVLIKPGTRIGQQGFGFHMDENGHFDVPQLGTVQIGHHVQIGSKTTIDRGSFGITNIGHGVRIDNLVQIAHNVDIGDQSVLVAQVGVAGSTRLGRFVIAAGQVGIAGHLNIGNGVRIAAQSGLMRDVADGETVAGSPAVSVRDWHKQTVALQRMAQAKKK